MSTALSLDALKAADEVIEDLKAHGYDYSAKRNEIALVFDDDLWNGNWDSSTSFDDGTSDIRFIQEDEYDQHMEDGDENGDPRPESTCYSSGHYVIVED